MDSGQLINEDQGRNLGLLEKENKMHSIDHHVNGLHQSVNRSYSFMVDIDGFSHIAEKKDVNANSIITRNFSRNGSSRYGEKTTVKDSSLLVTSPKATLQGIGIGTLEKQKIMGSADDHAVTQPQTQTHHHQISITSCNNTTATRKRSNPGRPSIIDPRRILLFLATLSCIGTILLIYFTLSMGQVSDY